MADIAFDAVVSAGFNPGTWSHTCSGTNRFLIVAFDGTNRPTAVTYNGVAMTSAGSVANGTTGRTIDVYYLYDPALGSHTVAATGGTSYAGISQSYNGVATSGFPDGIHATNAVTAATHSETITTTADACWMVAFTDTDDGNSLAGANTTRRGATGSFAFESFDSNAAKTPPGSFTLNFVAGTGTPTWASIAFTLAPAGHYSASLSGAITPTSTIVRRVNKVPSGAVTPTSTLARRLSRALTGTVTPAGAAFKKLSRSLSGSIASSGALSKIKVVLKSLSSSITPTGTLKRSIGKRLTGVLAPAGALIKRLARLLSSVLSASGSVSSRTITSTTVLVEVGGVERTDSIRRGSLEVEDVLNDAPNRCTFMSAIDPLSYYDTVIGTSDLVGYWRLGEQGYNRQVMALTPSSYWLMGEASGNLTDLKGAITGTANGSPNYGVSGSISDGGTAIEFDGSTDYFTFGDNYDFNGTTSFSLAFWIYVSAVPATQFERVISKEVFDGSGRQGWDVLINPATSGAAGKIVFDRFLNGVGTGASSSAALALDAWNFVVCTYDGATQRIYINGTLNGSIASAASLVNHATELHVGRFSGSATAFFTGKLARLAILSGRAISQAEITALYAARTQTESTTSAQAADSSGNAHHGTYTDGMLLGTTGALADGTKAVTGTTGLSYVEVLYTADLAPTSQITMEAWAHRTDWSTFTSDQRVLSKTEGGGYQLSFNEASFYPGGKVGALVRRNGAYGAVSFSITNLSSGWHKFAATYDGQIITLYIDGVAVATNDAGGPFAIQYAVTNSLIIGAEAGTTTGDQGNNFNGSLDEVALYARALTAAEIADHYAAAPRNTENASTWVPQEGEVIQVFRGADSALEFAGHILRVEQVYESIRANVAYHVTCQDYTWKLNRRRVTKRWTNTSATTIAKEIISGSTSGFTSTNVAASLATVALFECVLEEPSRALTRLCAEIGGNWYVDYSLDLHLFITEAASTPDDISDATLATSTARGLAHTGDLSQVRTRVVVIGAQTSVLEDRPVGATTIPVETASFFSAVGESALSGPNLMGFTGKHDGGLATTVAGNTTAPGGAPSLVVTSGAVGVLEGNYQYKVAFANESGETAAGPASNVVTGVAHAAPGAASISAGSTIGKLIGAYNYKITNVTALGETTGGTVFSRTANATAAPGAPSVAAVSTTMGNLIGAYGYKVSLVSDYGESAASSAGSRTASAQTAPSAPSVTNSGIGPLLGTYLYKVSFVGPDGRETLGTASSAYSPTATVATTPSAVGTVGGGLKGRARVAWIHPTFGESDWSAADEYDGVSPITVTATGLPSACSWVVFFTGAFTGGAEATAPYKRGAGLYTTTGAQNIDNETGVPVGNAAGTMGKNGSLSSVPVGPTGTVARRIYRTKNGGSTYFLVGEIGDNSTTTWIDVVPDTALTVLAPTQNLNGEQHTVSNIGTGPTGTTKRYIYRTEAGGSTYYFLRELADNTTGSFVDNATDAELDKGRTAPSTGTMGDQHAISSIPLGQIGTLARNIYRTEAGGTSYKFLYQLTDNTTTSFTDNRADAELGEFIPLVNTAGASKFDLSAIPTGGTGVTKRILYRTEAGGSVFKYVGTINDNSTTTFTDNIPDSSLGRVALTVGTLGALVGETSLTGVNLSGWPTSGWVKAGNQLIFFGSRSGNVLSGIPASGTGAILANIAGASDMVTVPFLSGVVGMQWAITRGDTIRMVNTRNDTAAQTTLAALEGGDGVHESTIDDPSLDSVTAINAAGDAELAAYSTKLRSITFRSRDPLLRSGKTITLDLGAPTNIAGEFLIQRVISTEFDTTEGLLPMREVIAAPVLVSFRDVLRRERNKAA